MAVFLPRADVASFAELLKLSNEVDLDALTNTTRALVSEFQDDVAPFAVELTQSLVRFFDLFFLCCLLDSFPPSRVDRLVPTTASGESRSPRARHGWRGRLRRRENARADEHSQDNRSARHVAGGDRTAAQDRGDHRTGARDDDSEQLGR